MSKNVDQSKQSIPTHFLCPISLEIMRDPVTLCTGQTYDRGNIGRWLASGHKTCPITMIKLTNCDLTPNHTLRRLIQDYYLRSTSFGLKKDEPSNLQVDDHELKRIVAEMETEGSKERCVETLCCMARESVSNRCRIADAGAVAILVSSLVPKDQSCTGGKVVEGIICLLSLVPLVDEDRRAIAEPRPLESLLWVLQHSSDVEVKIHAARLVRKIAVIDDVMVLLGHVEGVFSGLVSLIQDDSAGKQGLKSSFKALFQICLPHCNRQMAVQSGVVAAILETLPIARRKNTERGLAVVSLLCNCHEGRLSLLKHPCAFSYLLQTIHVSKRATELAITTLWSAVSSDANAAAEQFGWLHKQADPICSKLLFLLHGDYSHTVKYCSINLLKTLKGSCSRSNISGLDVLDPPRQS